MPGTHNEVIKVLLECFIFHKIIENYTKLLLIVQIFYPTSYRIKLYKGARITFINLALYIIKKHFSRWIGRNRLPKMLHKGIVCKFQTFFRNVGPQVFIHTTMNWFAIFPHACTPGVVPHTTPIFLLFVTLNFMTRS